MTRASFDALVRRLASSPATFSEHELLEPSHWSLGEDARLREDPRLRETPWGRWMLAEDVVVNDAVYRWLHAERHSSIALDVALKRAADVFGRRCVFCAGDPRFVLRHDEIHLAAGELSRQPVVEGDVGNLDKYRTHLPLHSLKAAAASEPAGEWGKRAQEQVIETLGWVRVSLPGRRLNDRMFIAAIEGHSMDDGKSGLVDGGHAVFELWPSGSKQNLSVLVRGAFSDPETGNYAVKKYVADKRGKDGRHKRISLVSLNPDKRMYPDIELSDVDEDAVVVVASVVQVLDAATMAAAPKPLHTPGRRDVSSARGQKAIADAVRGGLKRFFAAEDDGADLPGAAGQASRLNLVAMADALALEVGPIPLPTVARNLELVAGNQRRPVLGANVRSLTSRVGVAPTAEPWRIVSSTAQELLKDDLEPHVAQGLSQTVPTVFRVDSGGIGRRTQSVVVQPGSTWRVVVPPSLPGGGLALGDGWRLVTLHMTEEPTALELDGLARLGLRLGEERVRVELFGGLAGWQVSARGDRYPVFEKNSRIVAAVTGCTTLIPGELVLVGVNGPGAKALPLPPGDSWTAECAGLTAGEFALEATASRTAIPPARAYALVDGSTLRPPPAGLTLLTGSSALSVPPGSVTRGTWAPDPAEGAEPEPWALLGPPMARVRAIWNMPGARFTEGLELNESGFLDLRELVNTRTQLWQQKAMVELTLDAGEYGCPVITRLRKLSAEAVARELRELVKARGHYLPDLQKDATQFQTQWLRPVLAALNYDVEALPGVPGSGPGISAFLLSAWRPHKDGPRREACRACVLVGSAEMLTPLFVAQPHSVADAVCTSHEVKDALVTDGVRWSIHKAGSGIRKPTDWNLLDVCRNANDDDLIGLLGLIGEGI